VSHLTVDMLKIIIHALLINDNIYKRTFYHVGAERSPYAQIITSVGWNVIWVPPSSGLSTNFGKFLSIIVPIIYQEIISVLRLYFLDDGNLEPF